jgi:shikimate kinase / 3-dehydroquinate synthase
MRRMLLLNGFMATGKSTVGRLVARQAGVPFEDLDERIEQRVGASVAEIFRDQGEAAFRAYERVELEQLFDDPAPRVVALGGGALLERALRLRALEQAVVVTLEASVDELLRRAALHGGRPLLAVPDPAARIAELLEQRRDAYAETAARLDTAKLSPEDVAARVREVWRREPIVVATGERSYAVEIGTGVAKQRAAELMGEASVGLIVSDSNVAPLYAADIRAALTLEGRRAELVTIEAGEQHKTIASLERIWNAARAAEADRRSVFVALGGGVVGDLAGFAAATWMRGVPWVGLPTTLLAMVDASVGGKTAIDLGSAKNCVGAFWQPSGVVCDALFSATESERGFRSALGEVVKTALIGDAELFALLESEALRVAARDAELVRELVERCVRVKARIVSEDERERGVRATLNLGHTVGHALEAQAGYTRLIHGEAVSLGLVAALAIGEELGITPSAVRERSVRLLEALGLPTALATEPLREASALIGQDKKRSGAALRFVAVRKVGQVGTVELGLDELRTAVAALG